MHFNLFLCFHLASLSLLHEKSTVGSIQTELKMMLEMESRQALPEKEQTPAQKEDPLCGITEEEYQEMYERIRKELIEELMNFDETQSEQQQNSQSDNE